MHFRRRNFDRLHDSQGYLVIAGDVFMLETCHASIIHDLLDANFEGLRNSCRIVLNYMVIAGDIFYIHNVLFKWSSEAAGVSPWQPLLPSTTEHQLPLPPIRHFMEYPKFHKFIPHNTISSFCISHNTDTNCQTWTATKKQKSTPATLRGR